MNISSSQKVEEATAVNLIDHLFNNEASIIGNLRIWLPVLASFDNLALIRRGNPNRFQALICATIKRFSKSWTEQPNQKRTDGSGNENRLHPKLDVDSAQSFLFCNLRHYHSARDHGTSLVDRPAGHLLSLHHRTSNREAIFVVFHLTWLHRNQNLSYAEFIENSPAIPVSAQGIQYGVGHGFQSGDVEESKPVDSSIRFQENRLPSP